MPWGVRWICGQPGTSRREARLEVRNAGGYGANRAFRRRAPRRPVVAVRVRGRPRRQRATKACCRAAADRWPGDMKACRYFGRGNGFGQAKLTQPTRARGAAQVERAGAVRGAPSEIQPPSQCAQPARDAAPAAPSTHPLIGRGGERSAGRRRQARVAMPLFDARLGRRVRRRLRIFTRTRPAKSALARFRSSLIMFIIGIAFAG
jgi:hypothetical protein